MVRNKINGKFFAIHDEDCPEGLETTLRDDLPDYTAGKPIRVYAPCVDTWDLIVSYEELTTEEVEQIWHKGEYEQLWPEFYHDNEWHSV